MKNLNGWQRLWIVACFVWGVVLVIGLSDKITTKQDLEREAQQLLEDYKDREILIRSGKPKQELPKRIFDLTSGEKTLPELWQGLKAKQDNLKGRMESLTSRQLTQAGAMLLFWIVSCIVVYAGGLVLNWVYRGFRPKTN
ncbi:hypothetical protein BGP82_00390 [Pseudomonas putida]|uniref:Uncharacterized protein n=1 Tax=Pseudomonas putida TaxID=303 RepID=A0A2S3XBK4_PSEPU|nr:hypothetical protein [Pseudomonas putida]POG12958.1 hypothetical protein BGP82_00390 [Pseudomonas putida]